MMSMMLRTTRLTGLACVLGLVTAPVFAQHRAWTMPADGGTAVVPRHDGHVAVPQAQLDNTSPTQPPTAHPNPLDGELRAVEVLSRGGHFEHDLGEVLPVGLTYFGALEQRKFFPAEYQRQVAAIAAAGYQYARVLFAVGGDPYWTGHEVPPHDITTADGVRIPGWPDYEEQVVGLGRDFAAAGLQLFVSSGDLANVFDGSPDQVARWARRVGELLRVSGARVAFVDVNEAWQNWVTGPAPSPDEVNRYVIQPFLEGYGMPTIALRSAAFGGEGTGALNRWAGDIVQKHGHRGDYPQDHTSAVRHARGVFYAGDGPIPDKRVGVESEPVGPGASGNSLDGPEAIALLAAANFTGGFAFTFHSSAGVRAWLGETIDEMPGFAAVPRVHRYLPPNLMSAYTVRLHGGRSESPLTDADGFPGQNRVDSVLTEDGRRFVTLVYGEDGYTRLLARVAVRFSIITPDTGEAHSFTMQAGDTLEVSYSAGRVLVGEVL
jgi:hypothetical protein